MTDYSEQLIILKEWTRRYSENMREKNFDDASYDALQISKAALECIKIARELHAAQFRAPTETDEDS